MRVLQGAVAALPEAARGTTEGASPRRAPGARRMSPFVQIAVPHVDGPIFALDDEGRVWQTAGVHDGRLAWIELPTDQRITDASLLDGRIVKRTAPAAPG
jgi:hypothetical protein